jgi:hypothetical protein
LQDRVFRSSSLPYFSPKRVLKEVYCGVGLMLDEGETVLFMVLLPEALLACVTGVTEGSGVGVGVELGDGEASGFGLGDASEA